MNQLKNLKQASVSNLEIEELIVKRETYLSFKKRFELLENDVKTIEQELIKRIESGADINSSHEIDIRASERRYPSWKTHFAAVAGADEATRVLRETIPTIRKTLVVKS